MLLGTWRRTNFLEEERMLDISDFLKINFFLCRWLKSESVFFSNPVWLLEKNSLIFESIAMFSGLCCVFSLPDCFSCLDVSFSHDNPVSLSPCFSLAGIRSSALLAFCLSQPLIHSLCDSYLHALQAFPLISAAAHFITLTHLTKLAF